ncbi:MAG TPA: sugar transferase [Hyphomonadaceae bacterium]|nr:sugar transferase [Hyphomonadaceae bacterium]HPN07116.1 sugar transferase [Hyphomonadaceae bacterium]
MDGSHGIPLPVAAESFADTAVFTPPSIRTLHAGLHRRSGSRIVGGVSKRAFDFVMAAGALTILAPALLGIWALVRIESPGGGLFRQRRGGFQGRPFYILKFRTMRTSEDRTIVQAKKEDDRTTRIGRFLRRYSIDELPQLINVLLGDMSIVGPRPHALAHDRQFSTIDRRYIGRHHARPGITGLAQVSGSRGLTDTREKILERMDFDLQYVSSWSWLLDIKVIVKTATVVLFDRSAF